MAKSTSTGYDDATLATLLSRTHVAWVEAGPLHRCFTVQVHGQDIGRVQKHKTLPGQLFPWKIYLGKAYQMERYGTKTEAVAELLAIYLTNGDTRKE